MNREDEAAKKRAILEGFINNFIERFMCFDLEPQVINAMYKSFYYALIAELGRD